MTANYLDSNRAAWNARTDAHLDSAFYDQPGFLAGRSSLNEIELALLGDIKGKSLLHLQCHFGQDSISLARLGASVTGADLSDRAIDEAVKAAAATGADARFICCDLYSLPEHLSERFDIVFASYGTVGWLPDIDRWAAIVARYLKPGGRFVFAEFHPALWMFDNDVQTVAHSYFNRAPIVEAEQGSYADRAADIPHEMVTWNHGLSEVIGALLRAGLTLLRFEEYDYSPYDIFSSSTEVAPGRFAVKGLEGRLPLVYSLEMTQAEAL